MLQRASEVEGRPAAGHVGETQKAQFHKYEADPATSQLSAGASWRCQRWARSTRGRSRSLSARRSVVRARRARGRRAACSLRRTAAHDGCCNVCLGNVEGRPAAGVWVSNRRRSCASEADPATSELSAERVLALREMGAIDSWRERSSRTWEGSRVLLEAYRDAHDGCCNVPKRWKDDPQLGLWVMTRRRSPQVRGGSGVVVAERRARRGAARDGRDRLVAVAALEERITCARERESSSRTEHHCAFRGVGARGYGGRTTGGTCRHLVATT